MKQLVKRLTNYPKIEICWHDAFSHNSSKKLTPIARKAKLKSKHSEWKGDTKFRRSNFVL